MSLNSQDRCASSLVHTTDLSLSTSWEGENTETKMDKTSPANDSEPVIQIVRNISILRRHRSAYSCLPEEFLLPSIPEHRSLEQTIAAKRLQESISQAAATPLASSNVYPDTYQQPDNNDKKSETEQMVAPYDGSKLCLGNNSDVRKYTTKATKAPLVKRHTCHTLNIETGNTPCPETLVQDLDTLLARKYSFADDDPTENEKQEGCKSPYDDLANSRGREDAKLDDTESILFPYTETKEQISETEKPHETERCSLVPAMVCTDSSTDVNISLETEKEAETEDEQDWTLEHENSGSSLTCPEKPEASKDNYETNSLSTELGALGVTLQENRVYPKREIRRHSFESLYQTPFCKSTHFTAQHRRRSQDQSVLTNNVFETGFDGVHVVDKGDFQLDATQFSVVRMDLNHILNDLKSSPKIKKLKLPITRENSDSSLNLSPLKCLNGEADKEEAGRIDDAVKPDIYPLQKRVDEIQNVNSAVENTRTVDTCNLSTTNDPLGPKTSIDSVEQNERYGTTDLNTEVDDNVARKNNLLKRLHSDTDLKNKPNKHLKNDLYKKDELQRKFSTSIGEQVSETDVKEKDNLHDVRENFNLPFVTTNTGESDYVSICKTDLQCDSKSLKSPAATDSNETEYLNEVKTVDDIWNTTTVEKPVVRFRPSTMNPKIAKSMRKKKQFFRSKSVDNALRIWGLAEVSTGQKKSVKYNRSLSDSRLKPAVKSKGTTEINKSNSSHLLAAVEDNIFQIWGINKALKQWETKHIRETSTTIPNRQHDVLDAGSEQKAFVENRFELHSDFLPPCSKISAPEKCSSVVTAIDTKLDTETYPTSTQDEFFLKNAETMSRDIVTEGEKPKGSMYHIRTISKMLIFLKKWQKRSHHEIRSSTDNPESNDQNQQEHPFILKFEKAPDLVKTRQKSSRKSIYEIVVNLIMLNYLQAFERDVYIEFHPQQMKKDKNKISSTVSSHRSAVLKERDENSQSFDMFDNVSFHIEDDGTPVLQREFPAFDDSTHTKSSPQESEEESERRIKRGSLKNSCYRKKHSFEETKRTQSLLKQKSKSRTDIISNSTPYTFHCQRGENDIAEEEDRKTNYKKGSTGTGIAEVVDACQELTEARFQESSLESGPKYNEIHKNFMETGTYSGSMDETFTQSESRSKSSKDSLGTFEKLGSKLFLNASPIDDDVFFSASPTLGSSSNSQNSSFHQTPESRKTSSDLNEVVSDWKYESNDTITMDKEKDITNKNFFKRCKSSATKEVKQISTTGRTDVSSIDYLLKNITRHRKHLVKSNCPLHDSLDPVDRRLIRRTSSDASDNGLMIACKKHLYRSNSAQILTCSPDSENAVVPTQLLRPRSNLRCEIHIMEHMRDSKVFPLIATQIDSGSTVPYEIYGETEKETRKDFKKTNFERQQSSQVVETNIDSDKDGFMTINPDLKKKMNKSQPKVPPRLTSAGVDHFPEILKMSASDQKCVTEEKGAALCIDEQLFSPCEDISDTARSERRSSMKQKIDPDINTPEFDSQLDKHETDQRSPSENSPTVKVYDTEAPVQALSLLCGPDSFEVFEEKQKLKTLRARKDDRPQLPLLRSRQSVLQDSSSSLSRTLRISTVGAKTTVSPLFPDRGTRRFYTPQPPETSEAPTSLEAFVNMMKCCWICRGGSTASDDERHNLGDPAHGND